MLVYFVWATRERALIPGRLQVRAEFIYTFVEDTIVRFGGPEARRTLPFFLTIFVFILFGSLIGLTPIKFTFTSHLIVTFALALSAFVYVTILAFRTQGTGFFRFFLPTGTPLPLAPLMVVIELVSYLFRPVTLGIRLFANILSGHLMLKLFGDWLSSIGRNHGAAEKMQGVGLLAFALTEAVGLLAVIVAFLILFAA